MEPFEIAISDEVLDDLRQRLGQTRWPDEMPGVGWDYGSNLDYIKDLCEYWRTDFDWRAQEKKLNAFNYYKSEVDGLSIHFILEKGTGLYPMPLVITHGWPSTFFEMSKIIPLLADPGSHGGDPADSFDVAAPSLPGFGFSQASQERGMQVQKVADLWAKLMTENLGYPKFAAQGGDIGSGVTSRLGYAHSDKMIGVHHTSVTRPTPYLGPGSRPLTEAEQAHSDQRERWQQSEGGYSHIQGTKPQTLSYGLNDSPVGLAAWIVEKYRTWSDCHGDVESRYTKDDLLTIVTIYWVTQTIGRRCGCTRRTRAPFGRWPREKRYRRRPAWPCSPRKSPSRRASGAERSYDVRRWEEMPRGGHFAALEEPELLAHEVREFFRPFRG